MIEEIDNIDSLDGEYLEGERVYNATDNQVYVMHNGEWCMEVAGKGDSNVKTDLYTLNKQIVFQMGEILSENIPGKISSISAWSHKIKNNFYLMYGKEIGYFTLFKKDAQNPECENLGVAVIECLNAVGPIYSIEKTEDEAAFEVWIKPNDADDVTCMYLFGYDTGVVTYGK